MMVVRSQGYVPAYCLQTLLDIAVGGRHMRYCGMPRLQMVTAVRAWRAGCGGMLDAGYRPEGRRRAVRLMATGVVMMAGAVGLLRWAAGGGGQT